jgi:3-oxoacyl-[acyl-carrier-protein] synthase-1
MFYNIKNEIKMDKKILITGTGIISAMGRNTREVAMNLYEGKCGLHHDEWRVSYNSDLCGNVYSYEKNYQDVLTHAQYECMPLHGFYVLEAVFEALKKAKVSKDFLESHNVSLIVSNDSECWESRHVVNHVNDGDSNDTLPVTTLFRSLNSTISMNLASILHIHGLSLTVSAACAGGGHAIGLAKMLLDSKQTEMVIVIGAQETTTEYCMEAFDALGVFSPDRVQPFGKNRNGLAPSGGAACIILEPSDSLRLKEEKVPSFASLSGYGFSSNGKAITTPDSYQEEVSMLNAIEDAGLDEGMIDVVLAHATGTPMGDEAEAKAIERIFPICPNVVATKGMTGHECWMAGVSQAVQATIMFTYGRLFHAATTEENAFSKLNLVMRPKWYSPHHILCNAFGFGGTNSSFIISKV